MTKESSANTLKLWLFPSLVSIIGLLIWNDVTEIKSDIKALMAQSNIDKTRIDNLERQVFGQLSSVPDLPERKNTVPFSTFALLPVSEVRVGSKDSVRRT